MNKTLWGLPVVEREPSPPTMSSRRLQSVTIYHGALPHEVAEAFRVANQNGVPVCVSDKVLPHGYGCISHDYIKVTAPRLTPWKPLKKARLRTTIRKR